MRPCIIVLITSCLFAPALAADPAFIGPDAVNPIALLPPPPANQSFETTEELKSLHQIAADRSAKATAQALADSKNETVFLFAPALGAGFTPTNFRATTALFKKVASDAEFFEHPAKKFWQRPRPYSLDPSLVPACANSTGKTFSYPSGHSTEAWTQGMVLAALLPAKSDAIHARAQEFAFEREICGVHYSSDIEAGHVLGVAIAGKILASPEFQQESTAARLELQKIQ
jgi:acid phosphatase (class A)